MPHFTYLKPASDGTPITVGNNQLVLPDDPIVPWIEGDDTGPDIWRASVRVFDASVQKAYRGKRHLAWCEMLAGERAKQATGEWLPNGTLEAVRAYKIVIKGALTTPVGGGIRSLNVTLRRVLDLYACVRPRTCGDWPGSRASFRTCDGSISWPAARPGSSNRPGSRHPSAARFQRFSHPNAAAALRQGHPSAAAALGTPPDQGVVSPSNHALGTPGLPRWGTHRSDDSQGRRSSHERPPRTYTQIGIGKNPPAMMVASTLPRRTIPRFDFEALRPGLAVVSPHRDRLDRPIAHEL